MTPNCVHDESVFGRAIKWAKNLRKKERSALLCCPPLRFVASSNVVATAYLKKCVNPKLGQASLFYHLKLENLSSIYEQYGHTSSKFGLKKRRYCCEPAADASRLVPKVGYAATAVSGRHVLVSYHTLFEFSSPSPTIPLWAKHRFLPR